MKRTKLDQQDQLFHNLNKTEEVGFRKFSRRKVFCRAVHDCDLKWLAHEKYLVLCLAHYLKKRRVEHLWDLARYYLPQRQNLPFLIRVFVA